MHNKCTNEKYIFKLKVGFMILFYMEYIVRLSISVTAYVFQTSRNSANLSWKCYQNTQSSVNVLLLTFTLILSGRCIWVYNLISRRQVLAGSCYCLYEISSFQNQLSLWFWWRGKRIVSYVTFLERTLAWHEIKHNINWKRKKPKIIIKNEFLFVIVL